MKDTWMCTYTHRKVFPLDIKPGDIDIEDIARSLSKQCRYNGHIDRFYSVAEHSVLISKAIQRDGYPRSVCLTALLHDASEAYLGDIIKPLKNALLDRGIDIKAFELAIEQAISEKFGLPWPWPEAIHEYDRRIVRDEKDRMGFDPADDWSSFGIPKDGLGVQIKAWKHGRAYLEFMAHYKYLEFAWRS